MGRHNFSDRLPVLLLRSDAFLLAGYVTDIIGDAEKYKEHAGKPALDIADIRMAIQSRVNHSFIQPPPRQTMLEMARKKNSIPISEMPEQFGVLLPPEDWCLTSINFQLEPRTNIVRRSSNIFPLELTPPPLQPGRGSTADSIPPNDVDLNAPLSLQAPTLPTIEHKS